MTVNDLKKLLENYVGDFEIILAKDAEGNDFKKCHSIEPNKFTDHNNKARNVLIFWPE